jgi:DNA mismatch endonuclease, patch repair protein
MTAMDHQSRRAAGPRATILGRPPAASSNDVRRRMRATKQRDTPCELAVRSLVHRGGLRFRVDTRPVSDLQTRADLVFPGALVAVFIDSCFWHGCPKHGTWPKTNGAWWKQKIESNRARDARVAKLLSARGWSVLRIWAHEPPERAAKRIAKRVLDRRSAETRQDHS